jgi:hypothetical protein
VTGAYYQGDGSADRGNARSSGKKPLMMNRRFASPSKSSNSREKVRIGRVVSKARDHRRGVRRADRSRFEDLNPTRRGACPRDHPACSRNQTKDSVTASQAANAAATTSQIHPSERRKGHLFGQLAVRATAVRSHTARF